MKRVLKYLLRPLGIGMIVFVIIILINTAYGKPFALDRRLGTMFLYTLLYSACLGTANNLIYYYLYRKFGQNRFTLKNIVIGFIASFFVSLLVIFLLRIFEDVLVEGKSFKEFWVNETIANYIFAIIMTFVVILSFYTVSFYKAYQESKLKEQKIIAGTASAKFETLKNQIDPHFLFNSLNVLSSLIEENPDTAQRFTTSLSKIYRYVLEQKDKELISVEEELQFAKTYMNLLKMRFENSITFELPTDFNNPEAKVVPLSLQLLLENTIKHNVVSEQRPLNIRIYVENNYLIVENNLQKKEVLQDRRGVGLQNIVNRYGLISERKVLIEETKEYFRVMIPILTKQIVFMESQNIYNENMAYMRAKERVEKLKGFYGNLISYCCVIPFLIFINLSTSSKFQWFWFPMLGWGMGVFFHALETFGYGKGWEERKINEILRKQEESNNKWN